MNIVFISGGLGGELIVQQLRYQLAQDSRPETSRVGLLIVDAREMSAECFTATCAEVGAIRARLGLNLGVLVCKQPSLPLTVSAIRCGLHDIVIKYISAEHLRDLLRVASPGVRLQQFHSVVSFLRTFSGFSANEQSARNPARREQELVRKRDELGELERKLQAEKETVAHREHDLRELTRRVDRQLARLQTDSDAGIGESSLTTDRAEFEEFKQRLEKRSAELDLREQILNDMQDLFTAPATPSNNGK